MSEIAPTTTVAESVPTSTADVAANVIDAFESADTSGVDGSDDTPAPAVETSATPAAETPETPPVAEAAAEPKAVETSPAAKFLQEQGHQAKKIDGRDTWLPFKTVEKMLDRYASQSVTGLNGDYQSLKQKVSEFEADRQEMYADIQGDPKQFLSKLAQVDPRYRAFLEPQPAAQPQQPAARANDDRPQPDVDLGNGQWTYSDQQNERLIEWKAMQLLDQRLKPWEDREKAEREREQREHVMRAVESRTSQLLTDAQTWPGFKDHENDILKVLQDDSAKAAAAGKRPTLSLEAAYRQVVIPKLIADDNARRERILAELNRAPKSTAVSRTSMDAPKAQGPTSTQDIAARTLARLERGA